MENYLCMAAGWLTTGKWREFMLLHVAQIGSLAKPAVKDLIGLPECHRQNTCPVAFQVLPNLHKCFLWDLCLMDMWPRVFGNIPSDMPGKKKYIHEMPVLPDLRKMAFF